MWAFAAKIAMACALWLASEPDGSQRQRVRLDGRAQRIALELPTPSWFLDRLAAAGVDSCSLARRRQARQVESLVERRHDVRIHGLVKVVPGQLHEGILTPWSHEAQLLRVYYLGALDSYTVTIVEAFALTSLQAVQSRLTHHGGDMMGANAGAAGRFFIGKAKGGKKLFYPYWLSTPQQLTVGGGKTVASVLHGWKIRPLVDSQGCSSSDSRRALPVAPPPRIVTKWP